MPSWTFCILLASQLVNNRFITSLANRLQGSMNQKVTQDLCFNLFTLIALRKKCSDNNDKTHLLTVAGNDVICKVIAVLQLSSRTMMPFLHQKRNCGQQRLSQVVGKLLSLVALAQWHLQFNLLLLWIYWPWFRIYQLQSFKMFFSELCKNFKLTEIILFLNMDLIFFHTKNLVQIVYLFV